MGGGQCQLQVKLHLSLHAIPVMNGRGICSCVGEFIFATERRDVAFCFA